MVLLNILLPIIILVIMLVLVKQVKLVQLKKVIGVLGVILCVIISALMITDFHFYNWVIEYFKFPIWLITIALIISAFIGLKYFKPSMVSLLVLAFVLNFGYQFILRVAGMGGGAWEPDNCPDFSKPISISGNYNLIKGGGYFLHETRLNGLVYKEIAHRWDLKDSCETIFKVKYSIEEVIYNSCSNQLIIE